LPGVHSHREIRLSRLFGPYARCLFSAVAAALVACSPAQARDWQSPDSPYTLGEAQPAKVATCETAQGWIDHAPQIEGRVSFAISGKLTAVHWDGALGYLIMCDEPGVQVMCVTYSVEGRDVGETVFFAGGYSRAGEKKIMLDPCLASDE
jgi:hypothetical protein